MWSVLNFIRSLLTRADAIKIRIESKMFTLPIPTISPICYPRHFHLVRMFSSRKRSQNHRLPRQFRFFDSELEKIFSSIRSDYRLLFIVALPNVSRIFCRLLVDSYMLPAFIHFNCSLFAAHIVSSLQSARASIPSDQCYLSPPSPSGSHWDLFLQWVHIFISYFSHLSFICITDICLARIRAWSRKSDVLSPPDPVYLHLHTLKLNAILLFLKRCSMRWWRSDLVVVIYFNPLKPIYLFCMHISQTVFLYIVPKPDVEGKWKFERTGEIERSIDLMILCFSYSSLVVIVAICLVGDVNSYRALFRQIFDQFAGPLSKSSIRRTVFDELRQRNVYSLERIRPDHQPAKNSRRTRARSLDSSNASVNWYDTVRYQSEEDLVETDTEELKKEQEEHSARFMTQCSTIDAIVASAKQGESSEWCTPHFAVQWNTKSSIFLV